jgi:hypothetical protein
MTPPRRARLLVITLLTVLVAFGLAACGGGGGDDRATTDVDTPGSTAATAPPATGATTTPVPATLAPDADGVTLNTYFLRNDKVGLGHRRIARTPSVARAATELLLGGPTNDERSAGLSTAIPTDTRLRSINLSDGVLTVDLSKEFVANADGPTMRRRLAQLVFTLTQFENVVSVRVRIDGQPTATFGTSGVTLDGPLDRNDFTAETPLILVETVAPGDVVPTAARIAGMNNTFENNVRIRIVGADGRTLADTFTTGHGPMGQWGRFDTIVPIARGSNPSGKVIVFESSAKDGSEINVVEIPVRFA